MRSQDADTARNMPPPRSPSSHTIPPVPTLTFNCHVATSRFSVQSIPRSGDSQTQPPTCCAKNVPLRAGQLGSFSHLNVSLATMPSADRTNVRGAPPGQALHPLTESYAQREDWELEVRLPPEPPEPPEPPDPPLPLLPPDPPLPPEPPEPPEPPDPPLPLLPPDPALLLPPAPGRQQQVLPGLIAQRPVPQ